MYLREFKEEYKLLRNVNNPIIIVGLPLKLAFFYLGAIIGAVLIMLVLTSMKLPFYFSLGIPGGFVFIAVFVIKIFYKKYGINGFYQQRRDKSLASEIEADMSVEQILRNKINNSKIE